MNLKARHNLNFTIGKQFVNFGGYEYYVNSIRVREFSEFNNLLTAYQAGISGNWQVNPDHELCFQIVNNRNGNDEDIYPTGLPEGTAKAKIPFMYTVNWNSYYLDKACNCVTPPPSGSRPASATPTISPVAIPMRKARY